MNTGVPTRVVKTDAGGEIVEELDSPRIRREKRFVRLGKQDPNEKGGDGVEDPGSASASGVRRAAGISMKIEQDSDEPISSSANRNRKGKQKAVEVEGEAELGALELEEGKTLPRDSIGECKVFSVQLFRLTGVI